jgi:hypothetical protein
MKKIISNLGVILIGSVLVCSCGGNSVESDAKKFAKLTCKSQNLSKKMVGAEGANMSSTLKESQKLMLEVANLSKEMEGKYSSESDKKEFGEALFKEMRKCK